ncbi:MAG: DUF4031 domain-containing protein, partial [Nocardioidaceae bacterium]
MAILIDPPAWSAHGRLWSHLISDVSRDELHAFAAAHGVPRRGFERDHYDVPADIYDRLVAAGAKPVSSRDVVGRLAASGLRKRKAHAMARRAPGNPLLRPRHLETGDLVAVPATSGVVPEERLRRGIERIEGWGLRVRVGDHVLSGHPALSYLAAGDADRAADFTAAWLDPDVAAVWIARGGYGSQRVVDLLDWRRLAEADPKLLIGFSDVTALHQAVASRLGLVSIHGHVVTSLSGATEESAAGLRAQLMDPSSVSDLFAGQAVEAVMGGVGEGVLVGGNLAMLCAEVGTTFSRPATGGIAVLEEIGEDPYRVDRMLTQLLRVGWFNDVEGIVIGAFTDCGDPVELDNVLAERLTPLQVPIVKGFDLGHTPSSATVPLGVTARLDAQAGSLVLAAPAL